jgi:hypothetical protein
MATTKTKAGRSGSKKSAARKTSTARKAAVKDGLDAKQQSALERGGSLAQRNDAESRIGPESDRPTEITSAAPPNDPTMDEAGRASSPMFDEAPVTGKGRTATLDAPRPGPDDQEVKAGEAQQDKVKDVTKLEDLPPGSSVDIRPNEVVVHVAVAGGTRRTFAGINAQAALAQFNAFAENGPELFEGAAPGSDDPAAFEAQRTQFDKEAAERSKKDLERRGIKH